MDSEKDADGSDPDSLFPQLQKRKVLQNDTHNTSPVLILPRLLEGATLKSPFTVEDALQTIKEVWMDNRSRLERWASLAGCSWNGGGGGTLRGRRWARGRRSSVPEAAMRRHALRRQCSGSEGESPSAASETHPSPEGVLEGNGEKREEQAAAAEARTSRCVRLRQDGKSSDLQTNMEGQVSIFEGRLPNIISKTIQDPYLGTKNCIETCVAVMRELMGSASIFILNGTFSSETGVSHSNHEPRIVFASQLPLREQGVLSGNAIQRYEMNNNIRTKAIVSSEHFLSDKTYETFNSKVRTEISRTYEEEHIGIINILEKCMQVLDSRFPAQPMIASLKTHWLPSLSFSYQNSSILPTIVTNCSSFKKSLTLSLASKSRNRLTPLISPQIVQNPTSCSSSVSPESVEVSADRDMRSEICADTFVVCDGDRASVSCSVSPVSSSDSAESWQSFENTLTPLDLIELSERERNETSETMNILSSAGTSSSENFSFRLSNVSCTREKKNNEILRKFVPLSYKLSELKENISFSKPNQNNSTCRVQTGSKALYKSDLSSSEEGTITCNNYHNGFDQYISESNRETSSTNSIDSNGIKHSFQWSDCPEHNHHNCISSSKLQDLKRNEVTNSYSSLNSNAVFSHSINSSTSHGVTLNSDEYYKHHSKACFETPRISALATMQLPISSYMGSGTTYGDGQCPTPVTVPRYSAVPRSVSMLVNVSSDNSPLDNSSDSGSNSSPSNFETDSTPFGNTRRKRVKENNFQQHVHKCLHNNYHFCNEKTTRSSLSQETRDASAQSLLGAKRTDVSNNTHLDMYHSISRQGIPNDSKVSNIVPGKRPVLQSIPSFPYIKNCMGSNSRNVNTNGADSNCDTDDNMSDINSKDNSLSFRKNSGYDSNEDSNQSIYAAPNGIKNIGLYDNDVYKGPSIPNRFSMPADVDITKVSDINLLKGGKNSVNPVHSRLLPNVVAQKNVSMKTMRSPVRTLYSNGHIIRIPEHAFIPNYPPDFRIKFKKEFDTIPEERSVSLESSTENNSSNTIDSTCENVCTTNNETEKLTQTDLDNEKQESSSQPDENESPEHKNTTEHIHKNAKPPEGDPHHLIDQPPESVSENTKRSQFIDVGTSMSSAEFNSHKGKAALSMTNESDFVSQSQGWINFYMLKDDQEITDRSGDEGKSSRRESVKRTVSVVGGGKRLRRQSARDSPGASWSEDSSVRSSSAAPQSRRISLASEAPAEESWLLRGDCCDLHLAKFLHYAESLPLHLIPLPARRSSLWLRGGSSALRPPGARENYLRSKVEDQQQRMKPMRNYLPDVNPDTKQRYNQKRLKESGVSTINKKKGTDKCDSCGRFCGESNCQRSSSRLSTRGAVREEAPATPLAPPLAPPLSVRGSAIPPVLPPGFPWNDSSRRRSALPRVT